MTLTHSLVAAALCISFTYRQRNHGPPDVGRTTFFFVFSRLSASFVGGGSLTFTARSDYTADFSSAANSKETLAGSAEGTDFGNMGFDDADTKTAFALPTASGRRRLHSPTPNLPNCWRTAF